MASLIYLFIYLNKVFPAVLKHFTYTMAARILMEGNLAVPMTFLLMAGFSMSWG